MCCNSLLWCFKKLKEMNIPAFFAYPTAYVCRETINQIQTEYIAKKNQKSQIVILSIEINLPNEYSMFAKMNGYLCRIEMGYLRIFTHWLKN